MYDHLSWYMVTVMGMNHTNVVNIVGHVAITMGHMISEWTWDNNSHLSGICGH